MYETSVCSNESSEYELNADTLDYLYKEQLQILRDLVFRQNCTTDIELCRKWLKIFSKTSKAEKMARNCLCSLMQQQLQELGTLGEPFTNLQNCNRDLERVLRELDDQSNASSNYIELQQPTDNFTLRGFSNCNQYNFIANESNGYAGAVCVCSNRHDNFVECEENTQIFKDNNANIYCNSFCNQVATGAAGDGTHNVEINCKPIDELSTECEEIEKQTENISLRNELESIRLQLMEKQIENSQLQEIVEKYQCEISNYELQCDNIKQTIVDAIIRTLHSLNEDEQLEFPFKIFESIFSDFEKETQLFTNIKKLDGEFQQLLVKKFHTEIDKRKAEIARHICRKYGKSKRNLREKYERRLRMQDWAQKLQLKLVKLKCFSVLRQMFINIQSSKQDTNDGMWEMLRQLEEKYQSIVNEIM